MSGFVQDADQLQPRFYRVTLTLTGGSGDYTGDGSGATHGAVYPQDHSQFTTLPSTLANGRKVARGHLRFFNIIDALNRFADAQIIDVDFTSAGKTVADNLPTEVTFTVKYDRDANILGSVTEADGLNVSSFAPTTGGAVTIDTTAKALRYLIGQALDLTFTKRVRVYNGALSTESDEEITVEGPDTVANMYDDIAVSIIATAEVIDDN